MISLESYIYILELITKIYQICSKIINNKGIQGIPTHFNFIKPFYRRNRFEQVNNMLIT